MPTPSFGLPAWWPRPRLAGSTRSTIARGVKVLVDLSVPSHPDIFVIGDTAAVTDQPGIPGTAPAAKQMGRYVGRLIGAVLQRHSQLAVGVDSRARLSARLGRLTWPPFHSSRACLQTNADLSCFIVGEENAGLFKGLLYLEDG